MAYSLKTTSLFVYGSNETSMIITNNFLQLTNPSRTRRRSTTTSTTTTLSHHHHFLSVHHKPSSLSNISINAHASSMGIISSRAMRWWEEEKKSTHNKPNMVEIHSPQELVDSLTNADDRLVIVDFYSPACGGCKTLHPKICQLAESNPDAIFVKVNYEELKSMCHVLHIHVLPFFRFYRGAQGKLCSFSCTNSTIKKFKDALAKYGGDEYGVGPAKGLEDSEVYALSSSGHLPIGHHHHHHHHHNMLLSQMDKVKEQEEEEEEYDDDFALMRDLHMYDNLSKNQNKLLEKGASSLVLF